MKGACYSMLRTTLKTEKKEPLVRDERQMHLSETESATYWKRKTLERGEKKTSELKMVVGQEWLCKGKTKSRGENVLSKYIYKVDNDHIGV